MIRVLAMIAVAGFVLALATISAAVAIGGPEIASRHGWKWAQGWRDDDLHWDWEDNDGRREWTGRRDIGPDTTRTLGWSGAQSLDIDLAADVRYIQAQGPATVTVTGPERAVAHVVVSGDSIRYDDSDRRRYYRYRPLQIVVRAPNVTSFDVSGRNTLSIENYSQPRLRLDVSGSAEVTASGQADTLELDVSGNGEVDLGAVKAKGARVDIAGAADAVIAPTEWARLDISGMGDVRLLTTPPRLETDVSGAGKVRMGEPPPSAAASPPAKS